uniref:Uncharacterized protein n=1 Tax=Cacopsylla melanoneura TaxID=428564 RepID=A0A8D9E3B1_9HEMI
MSVISEEDCNIFSQYSTSSTGWKNKKPNSFKDLNLLLHNVNWSNISKHFLLTEGFMYRYGEYLDWKLIFEHQILSQEFLRNNTSKLYKYKEVVSRYQLLSEAMMREFDYLLDWNILSVYQKMSEPFIEQFQDKVNWEYIFEHQQLSEEFKNKFKNKIPELDIPTECDCSMSH